MDVTFIVETIMNVVSTVGIALLAILKSIQTGKK